MLKKDLTKMRHLYEQLKSIDVQIKELREMKEDLFDKYWVSKKTNQNYKIAYPDLLLTEDNLWLRDQEYIEEMNKTDKVKEHYYNKSQ